jgi:hypothetical protein
VCQLIWQCSDSEGDHHLPDVLWHSLEKAKEVNCLRSSKASPSNNRQQCGQGMYLQSCSKQYFFSWKTLPISLHWKVNCVSGTKCYQFSSPGILRNANWAGTSLKRPTASMPHPSRSHYVEKDLCWTTASGDSI